MIQELITYVFITGGFSYLLFSSVQPGMLNDWWLFFWAKNILTHKEIDWSELSDSECLEVAKVYKWIKPFGTCIKCFSFWSSLVPSIYFSHSMISFLFIFITSIILSVWLVAQE